MPVKKAVPSEHKEQAQLVAWWDRSCFLYDLPNFVLYACPNGGGRTATQGYMLKMEGVRAGIPDLFLAVPRRGFHGLYIEMKRTKGGRLSEAQKTIMAGLMLQGYQCITCFGKDEAIAAIKDYLT